MCSVSSSISSYNMHGFQQGVQYLRHNISNLDMWCIQEHWLYPGSLTEFFNVNAAYEYRAISCMIDEDIIHLGRSHDGLAVLWGKFLLPSIKYFGNSLTNRVMVFIPTTVNSTIRTFNAYFPRWTSTLGYSTDVTECISYTEWVYDQQKKICTNVKLGIIGDFNVTCNKIRHYENTKIIRDFLKEYNLIVRIEELERKGEYTYYNDTLKVYSFIDHCVSTKEIVSNVTNVYYG